MKLNPPTFDEIPVSLAGAIWTGNKSMSTQYLTDGASFIRAEALLSPGMATKLLRKNPRSDRRLTAERLAQACQRLVRKAGAWDPLEKGAYIWNEKMNCPLLLTSPSGRRVCVDARKLRFIGAFTGCDGIWLPHGPEDRVILTRGGKKHWVAILATLRETSMYLFTPDEEGRTV